MIRSLKNTLRGFSGNRNVNAPAGVPGALQSALVAAEYWKSQPNDRLIDLALSAAQIARTVNHDDIAAKMIETPHWPTIWPGEHYKLLSALVSILKPQLVVEIGTATGYSALSMKKFLPPGGKIVSFDIVPWHSFPKCILTQPDFEDGKLVQIIGDLTDENVFASHAPLLSGASLIFIDAAKDGVQERLFIKNFATLTFTTSPIFVFDDIRLMNMIGIWNDIKQPKFDVTSLGHWAGTGLVDWTG